MDDRVSAFGRFIGIDWSGAATPNYAGVAVAQCGPGRAAPQRVPPPALWGRWTRQALFDWLAGELRSSERLLVGFDFAFALPGLRHPAVELWAAVDARCAADADLLGRRYVEADPRFWIAGPQPPGWAALPRRPTEGACAAAGLGAPQSPLQLIGAKQVGKGALAGMRLLHRLRTGHRERIAIWPFETLEEAGARSVCVEIYPRLFIRKAGLGNAKLRTREDLNWALNALDSIGTTLKTFDDHEADALVAAAGLRQIAGDAALWRAGAGEREGWIFGVPRPEATS